MIIYHYNPLNGEFIRETEARKSPLDDEYLIPAHATSIAPPKEKPGFCRCFLTEKWGLLEDHRGETIYNIETGNKQVFNELGKIPAEFTKIEKPSQYHEWSSSKKGWVINDEKARDIVINEKLNEINLKRDSIINRGVKFKFDDGSTGTIQTRNESDLRNIVLIQNLGNANNSNENKFFEFKDAENVIHKISAKEAVRIGNEVFEYISKIYKISWDHKESLKNKKTFKAVMEYDINKNW